MTITWLFRFMLHNIPKSTIFSDVGTANVSRTIGTGKYKMYFLFEPPHG